MEGDDSLVSEAGRIRKVSDVRRLREVVGRVGEQDDAAILHALEALVPPNSLPLRIADSLATRVAYLKSSSLDPATLKGWWEEQPYVSEARGRIEAGDEGEARREAPSLEVALSKVGSEAREAMRSPSSQRGTTSLWR